MSSGRLRGSISFAVSASATTNEPNIHEAFLSLGCVSGTARSHRCQHDDDRHARTESRRAGREEPHGPVVAVFTRGAFAMKRAALGACRHVYLRRLAVIPAPAGNPPWHVRPSCVLTCARSARSRATDPLAVARMIAKGCQRSTPIVVSRTERVVKWDFSSVAVFCLWSV